MSADFAVMLRALMANRRLTTRTVSRASGRAEATINQLVSGAVSPTVELLRDIAPALQMAVADLVVLAGLPGEGVPTRQGAYASAQEIGSLVAAASRLSPEQVEKLIEHAHRLDATDAGAGA